MPTFSNTWFTENSEHWPALLRRFQNLPDVRFLEIGCFEGQATTWMLKHILTGARAHIDVVDTFEGSVEHQETDVDPIISNLRHTFESNIRKYAERVTVHESRSQQYLKTIQDRVSSYDFIYIDGSHDQNDVYQDAILSWPLLKSGGVLAFDDYRWEWKDPKSGRVLAPRVAIDPFLKEHRGEFVLIHSRWQLFIEKRNANALVSWLHSVRWNRFFSRFPLRRRQFQRLVRRFRIS